MPIHVKKHVSFLFNGGLDPSIADKADLRVRRMLAGSVMAMTPVLLILIFSNIYSGASSDNPVIATSLCAFIIAMYLQAYRNAPALAGNIAIVCYFVVPTSLMLSQGLMSTALLWLLPLPVFSILINDTRAGFSWCGICVLTVTAVAYAQATGVINPISEVSTALTQGIDANVLSVFAFQINLILFVLTTVASVFQMTRRQAEDELNRNIVILEKEVESRTLAEKASKDSELAKSAFFAAMGHELRTPLNGVIGAARLLEGAEDADERNEYSNSIVDSGEILLELINNVLDLSSLEAGKVELESIAFEIQAFVAQTIAPFKIQARNKEVSLLTHIAADLPAFVQGDPTRLRQILINLIGNALKFTETGSVELQVLKRENGIAFIVIDSGIGVPEKALATLFEPYVQASSSINRKFGGSGLGLSIVRNLIQAMDGKVEVESTEGVGTTITVILPLVSAQPSGEKNDVPSLERATALKILIADDNAVNRMVLSRLLMRDNNEVIEVSGGADAVMYLEDNIVDLVLMDIQMPVIDGFEATRQIRQLNNENSGKPVIAITANDSAKDKELAKAAGMDGFITKPFKHEDLAASLIKLC